MEKKSIIFTIAGLSIATGVGLGIYFIVKKPKIEKLEQDKADSGSSGSSSTVNKSGSGESTKTSMDEGSFPLKQGSKNKLVQNLQKALNEKYDANITADGSMGDLTTKAICKHVFTLCISAASAHRKMVVDKILYNDILAGKKRSDITPPNK